MSKILKIQDILHISWPKNNTVLQSNKYLYFLLVWQYIYIYIYVGSEKRQKEGQATKGRRKERVLRRLLQMQRCSLSSCKK